MNEIKCTNKSCRVVFERRIDEKGFITFSKHSMEIICCTNVDECEANAWKATPYSKEYDQWKQANWLYASGDKNVISDEIKERRFNIGTSIEEQPEEIIKKYSEHRNVEIVHLLKAFKRLNEIAHYLWQIIDDIDTASDIVKGNNSAYKQLVDMHQKKRWKYGTTDGQVVYFKMDENISVEDYEIFAWTEAQRSKKENCSRCKEWERLDLSNTCPDCDGLILDRYQELIDFHKVTQ